MTKIQRKKYSGILENVFTKSRKKERKTFSLHTFSHFKNKALHHKSIALTPYAFEKIKKNAFFIF